MVGSEADEPIEWVQKGGWGGECQETSRIGGQVQVVLGGRSSERNRTVKQGLPPQRTSAEISKSRVTLFPSSSVRSDLTSPEKYRHSRKQAVEPRVEDESTEGQRLGIEVCNANLQASPLCALH